MKVLCVSTLTNIGSLHYKREMTILQALRERGAHIDYVYCGGMDGVCDGLRDISPGHCPGCRDNAEQQALEAGLSPRILLAGETSAQRRMAAQWAASLADDALTQATWNGYPLGRWCLSSVYTHWRLPQLTLQDTQALAWYRALLEQTARVCAAMEKLLDSERYDFAFIYNARMGYVKAPFEMAKSRGLAVYTHERGSLPGYCRLALNGMPFSRDVWDRLWKGWMDAPLSPTQLDRTVRYLHGRRQGDANALNWYSMTAKPGQGAALREQLGIPADKAIWALFTSSNHEVIGRDDFALEGFGGQQDWIEKMVVKAAAYPGVRLVIRAHPNLSNRVAPRRSERELRYFAALKRSVGEAAVVILPEDDVSSYDLMDAASAVLCYLSTCGLESAALGKPVAIAANAFYDGLPHLDRMYDEQAMDEVLARYAALAPGYRNTELQRMALRLWHTYLFRYGYEFPYVYAPKPVEGRYAWFTPDALKPGVHRHLDMMCDAMLAGREPLLWPDAEDMARSPADEDAFLSASAASGEPAQGLGEPVGPRYLPAPLAFVVAGAPQPATRALNALSGNVMAAETDLIVVCPDGHPWRQADDLPRQAGAFRSARLETAPPGQGLCAMTVWALSRLLQTHESVILVDDAVYCAPQTLALLNNALLRYRYRPSVGCVNAAAAGRLGAEAARRPGDMTFAPQGSALGLGVWRDRWNALAPETLAGAVAGEEGDAGRAGLQRIIAALCAERGAFCAVPKIAHACLAGPEGAACRKGFVQLPQEHVLPFAPDRDAAAASGGASRPQQAPGAEDVAVVVRASLAELVARLRREARAVLVNLGCGRHYHAEWINIDMTGDFSPVIPWNLLDSLPLPEGSCDAIYSCHSLEHFHPRDARRLLTECHRALRPGGVLRVVVPDLEDQARAYLQSLDAARLAPDDAEAAARHDWMTVELLDQALRHEPGGQMGRVWAREHLLAEAFIAERMGHEFFSARAALLGRPEPEASPRDPARVGAFRLGGEVHQWMYDELSLSRLLRQCGFAVVLRQGAATSEIRDFSRYRLDLMPDGSVYRPGSLYLEALA